MLQTSVVSHFTHERSICPIINFMLSKLMSETYLLKQHLCNHHNQPVLSVIPVMIPHNNLSVDAVLLKLGSEVISNKFFLLCGGHPHSGVSSGGMLWLILYGYLVYPYTLYSRYIIGSSDLTLCQQYIHNVPK